MRTRLKRSPTKILVLGMVILILLGAVILKLPISNQQNKNISLLDSFFTATSAVCVTGLVTSITAETFSTFGQIVILCLIQIGGIRVYDCNIFNINFYWQKN